MNTHWRARAETAADIPAIREITLAAFDTDEELGMVDALRDDPWWISGLSHVATGDDGVVHGHALLTRCEVDGSPSLMLGPVSVRPSHQRTGAGTVVVESVLAAATEMGQPHVIVVGHPEYYPRFGFEIARPHGVVVDLPDTPDEAVMVKSLSPGARMPSGVVTFAEGFGL